MTKKWDFHHKIYDTSSQNWKYFGDKQSVVKNHWRIREFPHLRVGSSSLVVLMVHGYYRLEHRNICSEEGSFTGFYTNSQCMMSKKMRHKKLTNFMTFRQILSKIYDF